MPKLQRAHWIVLGLIMLAMAAGLVLSDRFGSTQNAVNVFQQSAALGLVSLGQTLVVLVGGIDLSIGAMVSALMVLLAGASEAAPDSAALWMGATIAAGLLIGLLNGAMVVMLRVHPLIVTIGMASVLNGATLMYTRQPTGTVPPWVEEIAYGKLAGMPLPGLFMLICFILAGIWLRRRPVGRRIYAVGGSPENARLSGIPVASTQLLAYAICGLCCAFTAIYLVARTGTGDPLAGEPLTLASITPVVLGGTILGGGRGGVLGTLLGVFLISLLNNVLNYLEVSTFIQWVVQGAIIIAAVIFQAGKRGKA